jgi:eukaryotic-like serine/threonine-protein kinase
MRTVLDSSVDPLLGRLLDGRYEVTGRLAQGGMAVVYTAFDIRLDRPVAVKVMHPVLAADEDFVARFRREAKAAARLSSPHVVAVTDQGRDGDVIFLVMELVEGRTLRDVLREAGRLRAGEALELMIPVLEALATAHRAGLVHRDVKPENVLVADDGTVKVGDFGLARAVDASPLTATAGLLLGTVAYLAPEQVARGVADARADVYACGVMLFELLTGRPPFEGTSGLQVAYQHLNDDVPPPSSLVGGVPPAVDRLVAAATARDPADRPHDATALLFRARAVLERLAPTPGKPSWLGGGRHDTAPLGLELAEAAALDLARSGKPASADLPGHPAGDRAADRSDADQEGTADDDAADPSLDHDEPAAKPGRRSRGQRRLLRPGRLVALLLILVTVAAGLIGWRLAGRTVAVPAVVGSSPAAAETVLRKVHLTPRLLAVPVYSERVPKGKIAAVDPPVGRHAPRGAAVSLKVSLGPERYTVPTVTGLRLVDAVAALRVAHLHPETPSNAYSDTVPAGSVISITPDAGTQAKPQAPVAIVASRGPAPVTAPKLTGMTADKAATALQKLGLKVTVTNDFSETVPIGQVIGVTPAAGLHRTQKVALHVSKGPRLVQIPGDIEDHYSPSYAKQYLTSLGLDVVTRSFPGLDSSIAKVLPGPGSLVRVGSQVTILLY